jgi:hypothetical protein
MQAIWNPGRRRLCQELPNRPLKQTVGLGGPGLATGSFGGRPQLTGIVGPAKGHVSLSAVTSPIGDTVIDKRPESATDSGC